MISTLPGRSRTNETRGREDKGEIMWYTAKVVEEDIGLTNEY